MIHDRRAVGAALAILIAADRRRTDRADDARLFLRLDRGGGVERHPVPRIALPHPTAYGFARSGKQNLGGAVLRRAAESKGKDRDLATFDRSFPIVVRTASVVGKGVYEVVDLRGR